MCGRGVVWMQKNGTGGVQGIVVPYLFGEAL